MFSRKSHAKNSCDQGNVKNNVLLQIGVFLLLPDATATALRMVAEEAAQIQLLGTRLPLVFVFLPMPSRPPASGSQSCVLE